MERPEVLDLYDEAYAADYDARFLLADWPKVGADFEASVLRGVLEEGDRWLDVACGTGYFLSLFPGVARAGCDLSPAMVAQAKKANSDALFVREADYRDDVAEWHGAWDLITCMWTAYNYVESMREFETLIGNLVRWVADGGSLFIPVMDLEDLRHVVVPYEDEPGVWAGRIALTSVTWTWDEPGNDKVHTHLIAPHIGHFVRLLESSFARVEVLRYPLYDNGGPSRKAVLCTGRRASVGDAIAEVVWHPPVEPVADVGDGDGTTAEEAATADVPSELPAVGQTAADGIGSDAGQLADLSTPQELPIGALPLSTITTELARRASPWNPRFRRGIERRLERIRSRRR